MNRIRSTPLSGGERGGGGRGGCQEVQSEINEMRRNICSGFSSLIPPAPAACLLTYPY